MWKLLSPFSLAVLVTITITLGGCASKGDVVTYQSVQPMSTYSSMDATALVYTDPAALAPTSDHPLRWLAFLGYPLGQLFDYGINRPLYGVARAAPSMFGYTAEDAMLDAQRPSWR
jgi:hypothetical protein